jgi:hypothetical protein
MQGRGNRGGVHDLSASLAAKAHPQEEGNAPERKAAYTRGDGSGGDSDDVLHCA